MSCPYKNSVFRALLLSLLAFMGGGSSASEGKIPLGKTNQAKIYKEVILNGT